LLINKGSGVKKNQIKVRHRHWYPFYLELWAIYQTRLWRVLTSCSQHLHARWLRFQHSPSDLTHLRRVETTLAPMSLAQFAPVQHLHHLLYHPEPTRHLGFL